MEYIAIIGWFTAWLFRLAGDNANDEGKQQFGRRIEFVAVMAGLLATTVVLLRDEDEADDVRV